MKRVIDTNTYVALKRGHPRAMELIRESEAVLLSLITIGELLFGFRNGTRFERNVSDLQEFLTQPCVTVLAFTWTTTERFGQIAAVLRKAGTPIPTNDIWIAAQSQESGGELLTFDRHFDLLPGLAVTILTE